MSSLEKMQVEDPDIWGIRPAAPLY